MGIVETKTPQHWNYFLALEDDVSRLARYLELTTDNFSAYSLELVRLLASAASEVDVVAKQLCKKIDSKSNAGSINSYMSLITNAYPNFASVKVAIPKFGLTLNPWEEWNKKNPPKWWTAHNKVKHHRHTHFSHANLKHALNAVSALFVLLIYFYCDDVGKAHLSPEPILFRTDAQIVTEHPFYGPPNIVIYSPNETSFFIKPD